MKLILQCAVCGTSHHVGTDVCATCRATGLENLRLLFECGKCYRTGLKPECERCEPPLSCEVVEDADESLPVVEVMPDEPEDDAGFTFEPEERPLDDGWDFELDLDGD